MTTCWFFPLWLEGIFTHCRVFLNPCYFLLCFFLIGSPSFAQERVYRHILTQEIQKEQERKYPEVVSTRKQIEQFTDSISPFLEDQALTLPIIFHVFPHPSGIPLVSQKDIHEQVAFLNRDFGEPMEAQNSFSEIESAFSKVATQMNVQFCLATPEGVDLAHKGIHEVVTDQYIWPASHCIQNPDSGGIASWNPEKFINIWVTDLEGDASGFAQMPGGLPATDGIVIDYRYFGNGNHVHPSYNQGKTLTHLMGNYLNLHDLWSIESNCKDDQVADTPIHNGPNYGCPIYKHLSTCKGFQLEMTANFMDNTDDVCMNMFTRGQKRRVHALFAKGGAREMLRHKGGSDCIPHLTIPEGRQSLLFPGDELSIKVYPNPTDEVFSLSLGRLIQGSMDIRVFSSFGLLMYEVMEVDLLTEGEFLIRCEDWPAGIYTLQLLTEKGFSHKQIVVR